ncbi:hypothetical protein HYC85_030725 [Camellia sinensis]|uniref:non-specific serine/threonine protein kinase n=1 Tax=Camellia sinensis TaxID=4442 RepID=A0A7J7G5D4_CAMSI|nr:hypothetical protein HYC85_030725 [Camellia sinensis]
MLGPNGAAGEYRPQFCGVQGFGLTCYGNGSTTIVIENQTFHVLHINQSTHNMTIARADLWDNLCPMELSNTTLNWSLFDYGPHPHVLNLTLFYDCLPDLASYDQIQERSHFQCPGGQSSSNINFFIEESSLTNPPYCKSIKVPVFQEGLHAFWGDEHMTVEELVKQGFEADYHEMDKFQACDLCNDSGGECGTDTTTNQAICFCHDGNQPQKCQGLEQADGPGHGPSRAGLQNDGPGPGPRPRAGLEPGPVPWLERRILGSSEEYTLSGFCMDAIRGSSAHSLARASKPWLERELLGSSEQRRTCNFECNFAFCFGRELTGQLDPRGKKQLTLKVAIERKPQNTNQNSFGGNQRWQMIMWRLS